MISLRVTSLVLVCCMDVLLAESPCPLGFVHFRDSCYWFSNIETNFAEARSYCDFLNSRLAVVTSADENDFIKEAAKQRTGPYYLGATDLASEDVWKWEGGLKLSNDSWHRDEPNNGKTYRSGYKEHCLNIRRKDDYRVE